MVMYYEHFLNALLYFQRLGQNKNPEVATGGAFYEKVF